MPLTEDKLKELIIKYPAMPDKIGNLEFLEKQVAYRKTVFERENNLFLQEIDKTVQKYEEPEEVARGFGAGNLDFSQTDRTYVIASLYNSPVPFPLLFEFNSFIISIVSLLDNLIDFYLSNKYYKHPKEGKYWDLGDIKEEQLRGGGDISSDLVKIKINSERPIWINDTIEIRDKIIHRICNKQNISLRIEINFWAKSLNLPIKKTFEVKEMGEFKESLINISNKMMNNLTNLSDYIIAELLK